MPEEFTEEHKKHYQYAGNSNLVLPSDRSKQTRRNERGKEMESLWGKITTNQMGSGIQRHVPSKPLKHLEQEISKLERKQQKQQGLRTGYRDILAATEDSEGTYRPRSRETRVVWDMMLALCGRFIGDQTPEVLVSAADEVLGVLKDEEKKDVEKRKQVEGVFGSQVGEADFSRFLQLSRQITDFGEIEEQEDAVVEVDEAGIAVVFGGSDAEDDAAGAVDEHSGFVNDGGSSDSDSEESVDEPVRPDTDLIDDEENVRLVVGGNGSQQQQQQRQQQQQEQGAILQPREIDAFWLQRQVARHFADPETLQEKTSAADRLLSDANLGVGELENELAELFDYEHFDLVQLL
ncbi:Pre-mRNA splicing, partial [Coemansia asiatica]